MQTKSFRLLVYLHTTRKATGLPCRVRLRPSPDLGSVRRCFRRITRHLGERSPRAQRRAISDVIVRGTARKCTFLRVATTHPQVPRTPFGDNLRIAGDTPSDI